MPCCYTWRHGVEVLFYIERALWMAAVLAEVLVVVRLFREGLVPRYPFFTAFLVALAIGSVVLMQADIKSRGYAQAYRICELILFVFRVGVAAELYEQICKHFPGIGVFRAGLAGILILLAGFLAVFTFRPNLVHQWGVPADDSANYPALSGRDLFRRLPSHLDLPALCPEHPATLPAQCLDPLDYRDDLLRASGAGYLAALLAGAGKVVLPINCAMLAVDIGCFVAWFWLMRRSGEEPPDFRRLSLDQVEAVERYNRTLLETVRSLPGEISARQAEIETLFYVARGHINASGMPAAEPSQIKQGSFRDCRSRQKGPEAPILLRCHGQRAEFSSRADFVSQAVYVAEVTVPVLPPQSFGRWPKSLPY